MDDAVVHFGARDSHDVQLALSFHHFRSSTLFLFTMKLFFFTALLGLFPLALAAKVLKSVIVTFPKGTPSGVIDQAKDSIVASVRAPHMGLLSCN